MVDQILDTNNELSELDFNGLKPIYKAIPPFIKVEDGFGYKGIILENNEGKIQCHKCGDFVFSVSKHLYHKHKDLKPTEYRKMFGLGLTTPLVSDTTRKKIKNNFLNLTDEKRKKVIEQLKYNNKVVHRDKLWKKRGDYSSIQYENRFGTCEKQAKDKFWKEYEKLGRIPTNGEMSGSLRSIVYTRFKTYKDALLTWGITEQQYREHITNGKINAVQARADNDFYPKFDVEFVKSQYMEFYSQNKRLPTWGEVKQLGLPGRVPFKRAFGADKYQLERQFKVNDYAR